VNLKACCLASVVASLVAIVVPVFQQLTQSDEQTRTADLISLRVMHQTWQGFCTSLQVSYRKAAILASACPVLHRIAFPVVSEWCQREDVSRLPRLRE
jgi:ABC-type Fe3+ transport system permease subunit